MPASSGPVAQASASPLSLTPTSGGGERGQRELDAPQRDPGRERLQQRTIGADPRRRAASSPRPRQRERRPLAPRRSGHQHPTRPMRRSGSRRRRAMPSRLLGLMRKVAPYIAERSRASIGRPASCAQRAAALHGSARGSAVAAGAALRRHPGRAAPPRTRRSGYHIAISSLRRGLPRQHFVERAAAVAIQIEGDPAEAQRLDRGADARAISGSRRARQLGGDPPPPARAPRDGADAPAGSRARAAASSAPPPGAVARESPRCRRAAARRGTPRPAGPRWADPAARDSARISAWRARRRGRARARPAPRRRDGRAGSRRCRPC